MTGIKTQATDRGRFRESLKQAIADQETVTLAVLDLDQFIEVNERAGYEGGDQLLALVSDSLLAEGKELGWTVGRIGGDEFAIIMPGTPLEKGFLQMEAIRESVGQKARAAFPEIGPTLSIGVANFPRDAKDATALLRQADHALYSVKEAGRNGVGLPSREEMVLRSCYYTTAQLARLKKLAGELGKKESVLLREALDDLLRKYDGR